MKGEAARWLFCQSQGILKFLLLIVTVLSSFAKLDHEAGLNLANVRTLRLI